MTEIFRQIVEEALENGFQLSPEGFSLLESLSSRTDILNLVRKIMESKKKNGQERVISLKDIEESVPISLIEAVPETPVVEEGLESDVEVMKDVDDEVNLSEGNGSFQRLFKSRYEKLLRIVKDRPDGYKVRTISSIEEVRGERQVKVAGLVADKRMKRYNTTVVIDDETGTLEAFAVDKEVTESVKGVLLDGLVVIDVEFSRRQTAIVKSISLPDIPEHTPTFSKKRVYAGLTSDLHIGSKSFLREAFERFTSSFKERAKDDDVIRRLRYLVIAGDLVDGVGVYPDQKEELEKTDIIEQYSYAAELLSQIPSSIQIFIIPGNHDPVRQALPQPRIPKKYAEKLYGMENVRVLSDPCCVKLHGVRILVFHGRSLDDVIASTPGLTFTRPASAMKLLLKTRHLAPIYGKRTALAPHREDHLVIEDVPDIFHAGHIHTLDSDIYRSTLILNSGSWQSQTPYQARMGIVPNPGVLPIVDLSTFEVLSRDFRVGDRQHATDVTG